jgi:hypothetical protein
LSSPRRPPINALCITAVGITSPTSNISSNTLTASSIRPLLHHQRLPWRSQGRRHRVPASRAEAPLRAAGSRPVPKLFPRPEPTGAGFPITTSRVCGGNHGKGCVLATPAKERRPQPLLHRFARRSRQSHSPTPAAASNHAPRAVAPTPDAAPLACAKSISRTPHPPSAAAPPLRSTLRAASTWIAPKPSRPAPAGLRAPTPASLWRRSTSGSPAPEPAPHPLLRAARPSARLLHLPRAPAAAAAHLRPGPSRCRQPPAPAPSRHPAHGGTRWGLLPIFR